VAPVNYAHQYPRFWLGYFVLSVLIFVSNVIATVLGTPESSSAADLLGLAIGLIGLWPLYGFIRQRRYNPRWLWLLLFALSALVSALSVIGCLYALASQQAPLPIAIVLALVAVGGPYLFALHQYLFRSAHLWQ
jgi:hypothetical protein